MGPGAARLRGVALNRIVELQPVRSFAPEALASLDAASRAALRAVDPELAELARRRVATLLGAERDVDRPDRTPSERACLELIDRFVVHVPTVAAEQRDAVAAHLGARGLRELVQALYVFDATQRLRLALGRLFEAGGGARGPAASPAFAATASLDSAIDDLHAAVVRLTSLDVVTTELVRIRCARYHDCKT